MKNRLLRLVLVLLIHNFCFADSFTDLLQDLAMQTACLGTYSNTEAGKYGIKDPHDYYTPSMLAERFAKMSGERTKIQTFYGICFDYAQAAWDDIKRYQSDYNKAGMLNQQWYIVAIRDNPNIITLYDPIPENMIQQVGSYYTDKRDGTVLERWNGVYCKKKAEYKIKTHSGATWHAWIWIQRTDGTWYWIDPTWTDNTGYVWWGYVNNEAEIQLLPSAKYCIIPPPDLSDYSPKQTDTRPIPQNINTTPTNTQTENYDPCGIDCAIDLIDTCCNQGPGFYYCIGYTGCTSYQLYGNSKEGNFFDLNKFGIQLGYADNNIVKCFGILTLDYLINHSENPDIDSLLFGFDIGFRIMKYLQPYGGFSAGFQWEALSLSNISFAWKVCGGFRFPFSFFCINTDISYSSILETAVTISIGIFK